MTPTPILFYYSTEIGHILKSHSRSKNPEFQLRFIKINGRLSLSAACWVGELVDGIESSVADRMDEDELIETLSDQIKKISTKLIVLESKIAAEVLKIKGIQSIELVRKTANIRGDVYCQFIIGVDGYLYKDVWIDCVGTMSPEQYFMAATPDVERYFNDPTEAENFIDKNIEKIKSEQKNKPF